MHDWSPWVYLNLEWGGLSDNDLGLLLTINFNKHHLKILGGRVWFGLRGGELKLELTNAVMFYQHRWPQSPLEEKIKVKHRISKTSLSKSTRNSNAQANLAETSASMSFSRTKETGGELTTSVEDEVEYVIWQISTKGSEKEAYWDFEVGGGNPCLQGRLTEQEIGKVIVQAEPYAVQAEFKVFKKDIRPLHGEGFWPENLSNTKKAVLLAFLRIIIARHMNPVVYSRELRQHN